MPDRQPLQINPILHITMNRVQIIISAIRLSHHICVESGVDPDAQTSDGRKVNSRVQCRVIDEILRAQGTP